MSTAVSTKRVFVQPVVASQSGETAGMSNGTAALLLIGGLILMAIGVMLDINLSAAAGFVAFGIGFLYLNSMLWIKIYGAKKITSQDWINRND